MEFNSESQNCDNETQTDYTNNEDDKENLTRNKTQSRSQNTINLNINNSRKRVLEDITDEENKSPLIVDQLLFTKYDDSPNTSPLVRSSNTPTSNVRYYLVDQTGQLVTTNILEDIIDNQNQNDSPTIPTDVIHQHEQSELHLSQEQHMDSDPADTHVHKATTTFSSDQDCLDLSLKPGSNTTSQKYSPMKAEKRVTILMSPKSSPGDSPITVLPAMFNCTSRSLSPVDKDNWYHRLPPDYQHKLNSTPTVKSKSDTTNSHDDTHLISRSSGVQTVCLSNQQGSYLYTPHPKTGQLFYMPVPDGSPQLQTAYHTPVTPDTITKENVNQGSSPLFSLQPGVLALNSSGEENITGPSDETQPVENLNVSTEKLTTKRSRYDLLNSPELHEDEPRETHNLKERRRRARIKEACDLMRSLIPGMSEKTDKATVFEFAARYIHFLKTYTGSEHDKDFLVKYSPY